jgi:hypothetical protein
MLSWELLLTSFSQQKNKSQEEKNHEQEAWGGCSVMFYGGRRESG